MYKQSRPMTRIIGRLFHCFLLSLLVNDKLWIFSVFLISADQQELQIGRNAKASFAAELTRQLIS